jgi:outer membrane murein-binding lipoprotein Lpp
MNLSTTEIIIAAVAGIATIFGLFGVAMVSLGRSREKLDQLKTDVKDLERDMKADVKDLEKEFKDDVKDMRKAYTDISIKLHTYIAARREEEKVGQDKDE